MSRAQLWKDYKQLCIEASTTPTLSYRTATNASLKAQIEAVRPIVEASTNVFEMKINDNLRFLETHHEGEVIKTYEIQVPRTIVFRSNAVDTQSAVDKIWKILHDHLYTHQ